MSGRTEGRVCIPLRIFEVPKIFLVAAAQGSARIDWLMHVLRGEQSHGKDRQLAAMKLWHLVKECLPTCRVTRFVTRVGLVRLVQRYSQFHSPR